MICYTESDILTNIYIYNICYLTPHLLSKQDFSRFQSDKGELGSVQTRLRTVIKQALVP